MSDLALLGGSPVITEPLPPYNSIGEAERTAVLGVMDSGCLSGFYGSEGPEFFGGPKVREFEARWAEHYDVRHAISVNSNTSGLIAAMAAVGVGPGDEVIVPPTTMSATVVAPMIYGGIPVFVDLEDETFCLDVEQVRLAITPRTRAILAVNLFGHPARLHELRQLADEHTLMLVEDNAQSPLGMDRGTPAGTVGHIGVFSLNYHKHIHTGEGGMCVTNDDDLAQRLQMVRNHGENLVESFEVSDLTNLLGFNFRMTELSAAVGIAQLERIEQHVAPRERLAEALSEGVRDLAGLTPPAVREDCRHNYYTWAMRYDAAALGVSRATFSAALQAEGFPHAVGYVRPLYMLPMFQQRMAIGREGYPFNLTNRTYREGLCPTAERLYSEEIVIFEPCGFDCDEAATARLVQALRKVHDHADVLRDHERRQAS